VLPERCALKFVSCFFLDPFCTLTTVLLLSSPLLVLFVAFLASLHLLFFYGLYATTVTIEVPSFDDQQASEKKHN
jgi:hypothetical protein